MKKANIKRLLEAIPATLSWFTIIFLLLLFAFSPLSAIVVIIVYLIYWVCRLLYSTVLLIMAHHRMLSKRNYDWLRMCREAQADFNFKEVLHVVLYTI